MKRFALAALAALAFTAPVQGQRVNVVFPGYRVYVADTDSTISTHTTYHVALEAAVNWSDAFGRSSRIGLQGPVRVDVLSGAGSDTVFVTRYDTTVVTVTDTLYLPGDTTTPQPDPPTPPAPTDYPNMMPGMVVGYHNDGTTVPRNGVDGWTTFWGFEQNVSVASDGLRVTFPAGSTAGGSAFKSTAGGPYRAVYISDRRTFDADYPRLGGKLWYWGTATRQDGSRPPNQAYVVVSMEGAVAGGQYPVNAPDGSTTSGSLFYSNANVFDDYLGQSVHVELLAVEESAPLAGDGTLRVWLNGQEVANRSDVGWTWTRPEDGSIAGVGFDGFEWHWIRGGAQSATHNVESGFTVHDFLYAGLPAYGDSTATPPTPPTPPDTSTATPLAITSPIYAVPAIEGQPYAFNMTAEGGAPPYSWASVPGYGSPGPMTIDASGVLSGTPSGAAGEDHSGRARVTDASGTSVEQAWVLPIEADTSATPPDTTVTTPPDTTTAPPPPPPSGNFRLLAAIDGTTDTPGPPFSGWYWVDSGGVLPAVVDDPEARNGKALRFTYSPGSNSAGTINVNEWGGAVRELIVRYRVKHGTSSQPWRVDGIGYKLWYIGAPWAMRRLAGGTKPTQYYTTIQPPGSSAHTNQWTRPTIALGPYSAGGLWRRDGTYETVEVRYVAESAPGAGDGVYEYTKDGAQVLYRDNIHYVRSPADPSDPLNVVLGFEGFEMYNTQNDPYPAGNVFQVDFLEFWGR